MIKLIIDGQRANLKDGQEFSYIDYNSLVDPSSNKGGYTLDIDIDLRDSVNAQLYKHVQRVNHATKIENREAKLYNGDQLMFQGIETILQTYKDSVKIQILCGNSELNFTTSDKDIKELELGSLMSYFDKTVAKQSLTKTSQNAEAVCCPLMYKHINFPQHNNGNVFVNWLDPLKFEEGLDYEEEPRLVPQPYFVNIITKVIESLGWTINFNHLLDNEFAKRLIVIHARNTTLVNRMIPNWKVSEFIDQVQKFFNIVLIADTDQKKLSIYNVNDYYNNIAGIEKIENDKIIETAENASKNYDEDTSYAFNYDSIRYDFPEKAYYKRANIKEEVDKLVTDVTLASLSNLNTANYSYRSSEYYNKPMMLRLASPRARFVLQKDLPMGARDCYFAICDQFKDAKSSNYIEGESEDVLLKIMPAETMILGIKYFTSDGHVRILGASVPYAQNNDIYAEEVETTEEKGLNEWIQEGVPEEVDTSNDKLFVAQYLGMYTCLSPSNVTTGYKYPTCFTHRITNGVMHGAYSTEWKAEYYPMGLDVLTESYPTNESISFNLEDNINSRYKSLNLIDTTKVYTFYIPWKKYNPKDIFYIKNKKFIAISLEYKFTNLRSSDYVIGKFLAFK